MLNNLKWKTLETRRFHSKVPWVPEGFFLSLGATEFNGEAAKASHEAVRKNLWHQRIATSLPCPRQFSLSDIRSQKKKTEQTGQRTANYSAREVRQGNENKACLWISAVLKVSKWSQITLCILTNVLTSIFERFCRNFEQINIPP